MKTSFFLKQDLFLTLNDCCINICGLNTVLNSSSKVQLNSWIQKASPAANTPGCPQPLSSEGVDLKAFQHFVCLTGNFYSAPVYFSFQLLPALSQLQALPCL